jgi:hypothetical protein
MDGNKIEITRPGADRRRAPRGLRPTERTRRSFVRSSLRRPSVSRTNVARARLTARPTIRRRRRDTHRRHCFWRSTERPGVCLARVQSTRSRRVKIRKKIKFHFVFSPNGRRREPTDPPKVPDRRFAFSAPSVDPTMDAKCPPSPEKKNGVRDFQSLASCEPSKSTRVKSVKREIFPPLGRCVKRGGR